MAHSVKNLASADCLNLLRIVLGDQHASCCRLNLAAPLTSPILISIDLEFGPHRCSEVGISILDPQDLEPFSKEDEPTASCISSQHFRTPVRKFCKKIGLGKPYRFGQTQTIHTLDLRLLLESILAPIDEGVLRDVVLIGHYVQSDIRAIKKFFDIDLNNMVSVKAIIDTATIAQDLVDFEQGISLKRLLQALNLDYIGLHNAAHDSRYTLRALLMLFCQHYQRSRDTTNAANDTCSNKRLETIERVAYLHDPRKPRLWCYDSKRIKVSGITDIMDADFDQEVHGGLLDLLDIPG